MDQVHVIVWLTHPGDLLGEMISFETHGVGQHAGFRRGNGKIHELYMPQVRDRDERLGEAAIFEEYTIQGLTDELSLALEAQFDRNLAAHIKYDIWDLFRIALCIPFPLNKSGVCSCYVDNTIRTILPPELWILQRINSDEISPRDIRMSMHLPLFIKNP